jgi:hypothetical protein
MKGLEGGSSAMAGSMEGTKGFEEEDMPRKSKRGWARLEQYE